MALKALSLFFLITAATAQEDSYRLPTIAKPLHYDISIKPNFKDFTFAGSATIEVTVSKDTKAITLHANKLQIVNHEVTNDKNGKEDVTLSEVKSKQFLVLNFKTDITAGNYKLKFDYSGIMDSDMYGFYRSSYLNENNEERWIAATHFEPTHARRAFPCFDEPNFKATFHIVIETPPGYHSLSNTPINDIQNSTEEGWQIYDFEQTQTMSTYLVAFIVSDFVNMTDDTNKYKFSAWARSEAIELASYSQMVGVNVVDFYETFTGINYTFPKIDQAALPDFAAGAMENWGLITYREAGLFFDEKESTTANKKSIAIVVAHELAHMWFGNLVTLDWWSSTWLNEGFAQYFQYLAIDKVHPTWHVMDQFVVDTVHSIFGSDALTTAQALTSDCNTPAEISAKFGSITYSKGASVIRMLNHVLTHDAFQKGIQQYLSDRSWQNSVPQHLFSALEDQRNTSNSDVTVIEFFTKWTTQPGFPVVTVTRNYVNKEVTITQNHFLLNTTEESDQTWWVPLTWTTASQGIGGFEQTEPMGWLKDEKATAADIDAKDDEWIILNNQQTGYYRVNYDKNNWDLIIKALHSNHSTIHVLNRAQLVDDSFNLARVDLLNYTVVLELTSYLKHEQEYLPWTAAFDGFSFMEKRIAGADDHEIFRNYMLHLIGDLYTLLKDKEVNNNDNQMEIFNRANAISWACHLRNEDCVNKAKSTFEQWNDPNKTSTVPADMRSSVYCTVLAEGNKNHWEFLWSRYNITKMAAERVLILSALGCTSDTEQLSGYLNLSIKADSGIRKQDAASVFSAVYNNPVGVPIALEFLKNNYEAISEFYGGMNALGKSITGIASRLTTEDQVTELEIFIKENLAALEIVAEAANNALETARANLQWSDMHKDNILAWMKANTPSSASINCLTITTLLTAILYALLLQ